MKALANTALLIASAIWVSEGVASGELGADQQEMTEKAAYTLAKAEVSTNSNWVKLPKETNVSTRDMRKFSARNNDISSQVDQLLRHRLQQTFVQLDANPL